MFVYIAHIKFKKVSFNSNQDIRQNVAREGRDSEEVQNNT